MANGEAYRHTQLGWPMLVILPVVLALPAALLAGTGTWWILALIATISIGVAAVFGALTVTVDDTHVRLRFGVGLIRKAFALADVRDSRVVRSPWYHGTGIRMIHNGWLYNVAGSLAVELDLPDDRRVRIGTNEPEALLAVIQAANPDLAARASSEPLPSAGVPWHLLIPLPILGVVALMLYLQTRPPRVEIAGGTLRVSSLLYSTSVSVVRITEVIVADSLPAIAARTNGFALGGALRGEFRLASLGRGMLYVNRNSPPFVIVRTSDAFVIVGFTDPAQTQRLVADLARAGRSP